MGAHWPVWYGRRTVKGLRVERGFPLPVQSPASVRQLARGFGKDVDAALSDCEDVFERIDVPNRILALQALRERWPRKRLIEAIGGGVTAAPTPS